MTRSEFLEWPHKAITLLGMSGDRLSKEDLNDIAHWIEQARTESA